MSYYVLSENDIENILKDGKFNKDDYAYQLSIGHWITGDIVENYSLCLDEEDLKKWEETYEKDKVKILEKIYEDFYLYDRGCEYIEEDLEEHFLEFASDIINNKEEL